METFKKRDTRVKLFFGRIFEQIKSLTGHFDHNELFNIFALSARSVHTELPNQVRF